ncbi:MAG TPA: DNA-directed RNA polymerase subunit beta [Anaerolineaceae bacterium]|nr:DNA-directed RNA polymerase subunit beta [Anaerolineaceae bacterium]HOH92053.1 DNA-directed RNA polymerase subunit beta [Anaerolineaceae bacterium]HQL91896.1 DNA-directed RNA polymerase subunit beta [Anaerolineaceae bacterium]
MTELMPPKNYARIPVEQELPQLIEVQLESFERLKTEGLANLLNEVSPIVSYGGDLRLHFPSNTPLAKEFDLKFWFEEPKNTIEECLERDLTYACPLYVSVLLEGADQTEAVRQDLFLGDFPEMTQKGTFVINGTERVVVSQLIRSPGVYFEADQDRATGRMMSTAKLIPDRGAWMEFETRKNDFIILKFNRKRTVPITVFLRALAALDDGIADSPLKTGSDEEIMALFADVDNNPEHPYIENSFAQEPEYVTGKDIAKEALLEFYRRLRPGEPPIVENAENYLREQLFDPRHYDLELVGRYKLNQKLDLYDIIPGTHRMITKHDIVRIIRHMIQVNNGAIPKDDIDHLGNRRVKTVGELIQNKLRVGLRRMERVIKERMSIRDAGTSVLPASLVNIRPLVASLCEFFGSSQLSQFMEETNPLSELRHKRTISALGPGGLRRERAGFDVRDVHFSHYGRICPIETPEGPNIGLIGRLAAFARVNEFGFIETPYRKVAQNMRGDDPNLEGHLLRQNIVDPETGEIVYETETRVDKKMAKKIKELGIEVVDVRPYITDQVVFLSADAEDKYVIAQANAPLNEYGEFLHRNSCRYANQFSIYNYEDIDFIDVAPNQVVGISAALIPFLEHDDANRALMGANMQTQAVPLLRPQVPIVSTGMEGVAVADSGQIAVAEADGEVLSVTGDNILVKQSDGDLRIYPLRKYHRSNQSTCIDQRPSVVQGQRIKKGEVIIDSSSTQDGKLALGQNVVIAFIPWEGFNFEDAILISEKLVEDDRYTSIHIEKYEVEARDTKLGPEEITREIPNVGDDTIRDLDETGIIRIGAEVGPNDILVGKITPKGEKELTPEERLLRAIFGEKSRDVKDTSLRMPHGERGIVVDVKVFTREENTDLSAGVDKMVRVSVAQRRKITAGDKMAGRHGNKGCVSMVVPVEDMPFLEDGTPVDIILNPLGIPGRMNIGQVLEAELGWAASRLGFRAITPVFDGANEAEIAAELARAWMIDEAWRAVAEKGWAWIQTFEHDPEMILDDEEVRLLYLENILADKDYDIFAIKENEVLARRATLNEWLISEGFDPRTITAFPEDEIPVSQRDQQDHNALRACLQLWAKSLDRKIDSKLELAEMFKEATQIMLETGNPVPVLGKQLLRDGRTGDLYDQPVMIGVMTMLKLHHLVEDKVHARSTGPYSLVTQQPLGGKAQFGGQRFGEMEVWALEAYGAAYTLQEMLTVKSDDVQGRTNVYESIVKGTAIESPGIPAAFRVLVKELQSLSLSVEAIMDDGEIVRFGKDDDRSQTPKVSTGLLDIGSDIPALEKIA